MKQIHLWAILAVLPWANSVLHAQNSPAFGGPSILSRGMRPIGPGNSEPIRFRAFASLRTGYDSDLRPLATDAAGTPVRASSQFSSLGFGAYGTRMSNRDGVAGAYNGSYSLYNRRAFSGLNQTASLSYSRQATRQWTVFVGAHGSTQNTALGPFRGAAITDLVDSPIDTTLEVFDNRMIGLAGQAGASYQATARLSMTFGGGTFTQRRHSSSLASVDAYSAQGEINYSLSRRTSVGATFSYNKYAFSGGFGDSDGYTWMGGIQRQLNRLWSVSASAGLFRQESIRVQSFAVDPQIAALTGVRREIGRFYNASNNLAASGSLRGGFRRSSVNVQFSRGQNQGNGFVLAGLQERFSGSASYSGVEKLSIFGAFLWNRQSPQLAGLAGLGRIQTYGPAVGLNYHLFSFVHATVQSQVRKIVMNSLPNQFSPSRFSVSAGLMFTPGEVPVQIF